MVYQPLTYLVLDGYDISSHGFVTDPVCVWDTPIVGIEAVLQGGVAPNGTFQVEVSMEQLNPVLFSPDVNNIVNVTNNSMIIWNYAGQDAASWNWVRLRYTANSGTGNVTVLINKKVEYHP